MTERDGAGHEWPFGLDLCLRCGVSREELENVGRDVVCTPSAAGRAFSLRCWRRLEVISDAVLALVAKGRG